jgi:hypothetical protein
MPKVRVVTPTYPTTDSIIAFENELKKRQPNVDYDVCSAFDKDSDLDTAAQKAVDAKPDAILACGTMAAAMVDAKTPACPIVLVGGGGVKNPKSKFTGYTIKTQDVAVGHLNGLKGMDVTVMYDDTPDPLNPAPNIYTYLTNHKPSGTTLTPLGISDPNKFGTTTINTPGFMLIPNAIYFYHYKDIADMVKNSKSVTTVYFPEPEYKKYYSGTAKVTVHGHKIPETFKDAAKIVSDILNDPLKPPPPITEGQTYP